MRDIAGDHLVVEQRFNADAFQQRIEGFAASAHGGRVRLADERIEPDVGENHDRFGHGSRIFHMERAVFCALAQDRFNKGRGDNLLDLVNLHREKARIFQQIWRYRQHQALIVAG